MSDLTSERFNQAVAIQDGGASNLRALVRILARSIDEACEEATPPNEDPAVALIVHQMAHLCGWYSTDMDKWSRCYDYCRAMST